jgi:probable rRNA maturation factor
MILLDPDLDPDPAPSTASAKQTVAPAGGKGSRNSRLPSARTLGRFLSEAQVAVRLKGEVTVLLTTDAAIRKLNRRFRGKNEATDVLSFPAEGPGAEKIAGDLAISVPTALSQAGDQGHSLSTEIKVLILHGLLHLAGGDHEADAGQMARRERLLRGRLGLPQGLIERMEMPKARSLYPIRKDPRLAAMALKGHGFSRAARSPKKDAALAAEGVQVGGEAFPQGLKPKTSFAHQAARLKSCPFKTDAHEAARLKSCPDTMPGFPAGRSLVNRPASKPAVGAKRT